MERMREMEKGDREIRARLEGIQAKEASYLLLSKAP